MVELYNDFFKFPALVHEVRATFIAQGAAHRSAAGMVGALAAVRHVVSLAPAEAMRPQAPEKFRQTLIERLGLRRECRLPCG